MKTHHLLAIALGLSAPAAFAFPFTVPQMIRGDLGEVVAVADFNRDGKAEILVASTHSLYWLQHTTGTTFTQAASLTWAAPVIDEVLTPDIDGDGDTDVVLNTTGPSQLVILRNNGNFSFTKALETAVGASALEAGAVVGDYDNDGDLDAGLFHTVAGETVRRITWAAQDAGAFTLQSPPQNAASIDWRKAVMADFNLDGFMDEAISATDLYAYRGTPSGVFLTWPSATFTGGTTHMEAGDVDRDGFPDLVLTSGTTPTGAQRAAWFRWNGAGFDAADTIQNHTTGRISSTHLVDVDEDDDLDAVFGDQSFYVDAANQGPVNLMWAENSGGDFLAPRVLAGAYEAAQVRSGDVDGDGDVDIVCSGNNDVQWLTNQAIHRSAVFGSTNLAGSSQGFGDFGSVDMNNDGETDLIWTLPGPGIVSYTTGHTYADPPGAGAVGALPQTIPGAGAVAAGDMNHDGKADLVIAAGGEGQLKLASRDNSNVWQLTNIAPLPAGTAELVVCDVNRDGNNDVVAGHATGITIFYSNGSFSPTWTEQSVVNNIGPVTKICPVQLNGLSYLELMAMTVETSPARCRIYRYFFTTFGIWSNAAALWEGDSASSLLATGDANRDNARDVIYAVTAGMNCAPSGVTTIALGASKVINGAPAGLRFAESADFDNDGITDIVAGGSGTVLLFRGRGDGTFFAAESTGYSGPVDGLLVYDYEHDGDMDILVRDDSAGQIILLYNRCGQYSLTETALGEVIPATPSSAPLVMHLTFTHGGRSGDAAASLRSLRFRLLGLAEFNGSIVTAGGLTTAEATSLLSAVEVYQDSGEIMNFESGTDALVGTVGPATSTGYLTVTPSPPINFNPGQTVRLWVRLRMSANAGSSAIHSFRFEHITDTAAAGTMVAHGGLTSSNFRLDPMILEDSNVRILIPGALEAWRLSNFGTYIGTGDAANDADPDNDGVPNLVEYVMSRDPKSSGGLGGNTAPLDLIYTNRQTPVVVNLRTLINYDSRVRLTIQSTTNMQNWSTLTSRTGTGAWSIAPDSATTLGGGRAWFKFNATSTPQNTFKQYFRLKADELP